jgi:hypothetical protein
MLLIQSRSWDTCLMAEEQVYLVRTRQIQTTTYRVSAVNEDEALSKVRDWDGFDPEVVEDSGGVSGHLPIGTWDVLNASGEVIIQGVSVVPRHLRTESP